MSLNRPTEVLSGDLDFFWAYTLVDITDTGYSNPKGNTKPFRQAQNLNTLIQILSLRTQLVISSVKILENQNLSNYNFGTNYTGSHTVWQFKFASEKSDSWQNGTDTTYFAKADCHGVPVNTSLDETVAPGDIFDVSSSDTLNIYFESSESL